jgi:outer membrane protein assembly factor BamB
MDNRTYNSTSIGSNVDWQAGVFGSISTISPSPQAPTGCRILGYSLQTGELICNFTDTYVPYQTATVAVDHGKIACLMVDGYDVCYDLRQGKRVWVSQQTYSVGGYPWGIWGAYSSASYGGNHILCLYDGVYAFNWETGKISWVYKAPSVAFETPYAGWTSFDSGVSIADGKIFVANSEHTPSQPITRGWKLHCINATTGKGIWNISAGGGAMGGGYAIGAMADGYLTAGGTDGYMYVFGRGKSATTVTATPAVIANGATVLIQGTVLDQSPAQPGAACVSDESQATYMEYLHIQQPLDGIFHNITITGVPVLLLAVDSDGTVTNIGTTTSDVSGCFKTAWTPPKEGVYTVTATFAGSESYGSSWAETAVAVGPAPASPTPTPTPPAAAPAPDTTPYIIGMGIAIIIAVAIVGILLLRKRP